MTMASGSPDSRPATARAPDWAAPVATGPLRARVDLPGSKSLTNRALILAALSQRPVRITSPLRARDTALMAGALRSLGVGITEDGADWVVTPAVLRGGPIDCGLAGTVMRFVPPLAGLADGASLFDGDPHARTRPMGTLIDGLRLAGVQVDDEGSRRLPFTVRGRGAVLGGPIELDASASSQFVSALLLAGARFERGVQVAHLGGPLPSLPHIAMTVAILRDAGVEVDDSRPDLWTVQPGDLQLPDLVVEPDLSNAAPFLAAALVAGGSVTVPHWPASTTQAGDALRGLLEQLGGRVQRTPDGLTVTGQGRIAPLVADLHDVSELTPVLAALCAQADGESRLSGVAHIRGHETDRLAALRTELTAVGAEVRETEDGLVIRPAPLTAGRWHAYADHRMAQAGAVLGLAVPGLVVDDISSTTKTMADFPGLWAQLLDQRADTLTTVPGR
jgi:3-phosphoshikimate 1-carboxyvinyltransferase